ncbi:hypothetical protein KO489_04310 [Reinekea forsetii]|nr:hypothetical protein [Reinekea forsetii]
MKHTLLSSIFVSFFVLGCSSKPSIVSYDASVVSGEDHLPLPADAPAQVNIDDIEVPRLTLDISSESNATTAPLSVEKITDSFGQTSLKINRNTASSWELVDQALIELAIETTDRNRSEYRFELASSVEKQGLLARLFSKKTKPLLLVLIPSGQNTILSLESTNDELPDSKQTDELFEKLLTHWSE